TVEAYPATPAARCIVRGIGARLARTQLPPTERRNMADELNRFFPAIVGIQISSRKSHAPTGLDRWVGFKNDAVYKRGCLADHRRLPSTQAELIDPQNRPQPMRHQINCGSYHQVLKRPQRQRQNWR